MSTIDQTPTYCDQTFANVEGETLHVSTEDVQFTLEIASPLRMNDRPVDDHLSVPIHPDDFVDRIVEDVVHWIATGLEGLFTVLDDSLRAFTINSNYDAV